MPIIASSCGSVGEGDSERAYKAFFNSVPSSPAAASSVRDDSVSSRPADIYRSYMDNYHRRLRKAQPRYGDDAAGLVCGSKYQGRKTPLKGKGSPPPDNYEPQFHPSKRLVPGKSYFAVKDLLSHEHDDDTNPMSMSMDSGMLALAKAGALSPRPQSAAGGRTCLKLTDQSFRSSLQGSGLAVISEVPQHRPIRKPGTAAPTAGTKARVMVLTEDVAAEADAGAIPADWDIATPRERFIKTAWDRQWAEAAPSLNLTRSLDRPATAPTPATKTAVTHEARRRYHEIHTGANQDLFHYRHSGGICPAEYKMEGTRLPAPQLSPPSANAARDAFFAARLGYAQNRVRSKMSDSAYA